MVPLEQILDHVLERQPRVLGSVDLDAGRQSFIGRQSLDQSLDG